MHLEQVFYNTSLGLFNWLLLGLLLLRYLFLSHKLWDMGRKQYQVFRHKGFLVGVLFAVSYRHFHHQRFRRLLPHPPLLLHFHFQMKDIVVLISLNFIQSVIYVSIILDQNYCI